MYTLPKLSDSVSHSLVLISEATKLILVAGGSWTEPNNSMRAFTSAGIQWLKNSVNSEGRKPTDFNS